MAGFRMPPRPMFGSKQRRPRVENGSHLDFIRSLPCLCCGAYGVDAAHVSMAAPHLGKRARGLGEKASDSWTVPLCRPHHDEQHKMNEAEFWLRRGIDPLLIALALWHATGDHEIGESIVLLNMRQAA